MAQSIWPALANTEPSATRISRSTRNPQRRGQLRAGTRVLIVGAYNLRERRHARQAYHAALAALEGRAFVIQNEEPPSPTSAPVLLRQLPYKRLLKHAVALFLILVAIFLPSFPLHSPPSDIVFSGSTNTVMLASDGPAGFIVQSYAPGFAADPGEAALSEHSQLAPDNEPAFTEYHTLQEGETLGEVAARYGIDVASLFWANGLQSDTIIPAGRELRIPRLAGIPYIIQPDDTLLSIAEHFQVKVEAITLFKANAIKDASPLAIGQEIFVAGARQAYPDELLKQLGGEAGVAAMRAVVTGAVYEDKTNLREGPGRSYARVGYLDAGIHLQPIARHEQWVKVDAGSAGSGWVRADMIALSDAAFNDLPTTNDFPPLPPRWVWPSSGAFTSPFGWRTSPFRSFHNGIDIANRAGTPIVAARSGRVVQAGWCSGYGYCVRINHGEGIESTYGHLLRKPPVAAGDDVEAGDLIGLMGSTYDRAGGGYSTGVHLHFTIKINGEAVNPLKYLP